MTVPTQSTLWLRQLRKHRSIKLTIALSVTGINLSGNTEAVLKQSTRGCKCAVHARDEVMPCIGAYLVGGSAA